MANLMSLRNGRTSVFSAALVSVTAACIEPDRATAPVAKRLDRPNGIYLAPLSGRTSAVTPIAGLPADFTFGQAVRVNNADRVLVRGILAGQSRLVLVDLDGTSSSILPEGFISGGLFAGLNNADAVAGESFTTVAEPRPASVWAAGVVTPLPLLVTPDFVALSSTVNDINDAGDVVGQSSNQNGQFRATLWSGGAATELLELAVGAPSMPFVGAINNSGVVVGVTRFHATLWASPNAPVDLTPGLSGQSGAIDINDAGVVVGQTETADFSGRQAAMWHNGQTTILGGIGHWSEAYSVNAAGQVVGDVYRTDNTDHAALWDNGELTLLAEPPGTTRSRALSINDDGVIVGFVLSGSSSNVVVTPVRWIVAPPDQSPPVIQPTVIGSLGSNGWYTSNIAVSWLVTDPESAISASTGCGPVSVIDDAAGTTFACSATSAGGTATQSVTVKRDATAPLVTASAGPGANAFGWRKQNVTVTFTGTDALSGGVVCDPNVILSSNGANQSASGRCRDAAGNIGSATAGGINIDKTSPLVDIVRPADGATYGLNHQVTASYSCADALSGIDSCVGSIAVGQLLATSKRTKNAKFTVAATDRAGNTTKRTVTYSVQ